MSSRFCYLSELLQSLGINFDHLNDESDGAKNHCVVLVVEQLHYSPHVVLHQLGHLADDADRCQCGLRSEKDTK